MLPHVTPRFSPTTGTRMSGPNSPALFLSSKSSQNTVLRFLSQFWLYYTTQQSKYSLHLLITAASLMISGLVPHPIITFVLPLFFHLKLCSTLILSILLWSIDHFSLWIFATGGVISLISYFLFHSTTQQPCVSLTAGTALFPPLHRLLSCSTVLSDSHLLQ